jgi:hypothetical protein
MAKKKTLKSLYTEILGERGKTLGECLVVGYKFKSVTASHSFHFSIMNRIDYLLYDGPGCDVIVVLDKWTEQVDELRRIAELCGGQEYKPYLKY